MTGWEIAGLCVLVFGGFAVALLAAWRSKLPPLETPVRMQWEPPSGPARGYFVLLGIQYGGFLLLFLAALTHQGGLMLGVFIIAIAAMIVRLFLDHVRSARWQRERRARWEAEREQAKPD